MDNDIRVGLLERIKNKRKEQQKEAAESDDDECKLVPFLEDDTGEVVSARIHSLDVSGSPDKSLSQSSDPFLDFVAGTPSPVFARKFKKTHRCLSSVEGKQKLVPKMEPTNIVSVSDQEGTSSTNKGKSLVLDNKDHEICMESAAIVLKAIGSKYGYSSGSGKSVHSDGELITADCKHDEEKQRKAALERLKVLREKRKARGEVTPEKQNVSHKFPRYNSGYLGWPSESESESESDSNSNSNSDSDDCIPIRSMLSKCKASSKPTETTQINGFSSRHKGAGANSSTTIPKSSLIKTHTAYLKPEDVKIKTRKKRSNMPSADSACDKHLHSSSSVSKLTSDCDKNGKLINLARPNNPPTKHNAMNQGTDPKSSPIFTTASGAIPKTRISSRGSTHAKNFARLPGPSMSSSTPVLNNALYASPSLRDGRKRETDSTTNHMTSHSESSREQSTTQWQTPPACFVSNQRRSQEPLLNTQSSSSSSSSVASSVGNDFLGNSERPPRIVSPDLILLGISPPTSSLSQRTGKRQRTGTRAADMRKQRTVRHGATSRRTNNIAHIPIETDAIQVIEQITTDEDYARKLQEEMDKEFAFSLVQDQNFMEQTPRNPTFHPGDPTYGHNLDFVHVNNLNFGPHHWHSPPRRRTMHNARAVCNSRNRRINSGTGELHLPVDVDMVDGELMNTVNGNYGMNLLNPRYPGGNNALEMMESHLMALLEDTPPRRGRRTGSRRNARYNGVGFYSPMGGGNDYETLLQLAEELGDVRQKGICHRQINRLPVKKYKKADKASGSDPEECSICMCEYEEDDNVRILPCFHRFHACCVDKWLQGNASCPVCRVQVKLD